MVLHVNNELKHISKNHLRQKKMKLFLKEY